MATWFAPDFETWFRRGDFRPCVIKRKDKYIAWTRTWEGPARPDWAAARADLTERLMERKDG